ncbi:hypothetical protein [Rhizosphaericola mali]|uniref:TIGR04255 family protein n=1 Tax=Rhizosphaericola mali TaxID=2545455 RepID=A0A5P2FVQ5_9BACT|nr:hypothetical protein [Rhizosphaericola mali]QES87586.1 hypothetical protein E0W69_002520 [Rhizosphaericola mali]
MIEYINPIRQDSDVSNAIKLAKVVFFFPQEVISPEELYNGIKTELESEGYSKNALHIENNLNFKIQNGAGILSNTLNQKIKGFLFEKYTNGSKEYVLKLENQSATFSRSYISLELFKYESWALFKEEVRKVITKILSNDKYSFYIIATTIEYIDEFQWISAPPDTKIKLGDVFEENSGLLNKNFFEGSEIAGQIIQINKMEDKEVQYNISYHNGARILTIRHIETSELAKPQYAKDINGELSSLIDTLHNNNKQFITDLLTSPMLDKIGLKK